MRREYQAIIEVLITLSTLACVSHQADLKVRWSLDPNFGARFEVPANWLMDVPTDCRHNGICSLYIRPSNYKAEVQESEHSLPPYVIEVKIMHYSYERILYEQAFENESSGWVFHGGRMGEGGEVRKIAGKGWEGLQASGNAGVYMKEGGYYGYGGEFYLSVITNSRGWCAIITLHDISYKNTYDRLLKTWKFARFTYDTDK